MTDDSTGQESIDQELQRRIIDRNEVAGFRMDLLKEIARTSPKRDFSLPHGIAVKEQLEKKYETVHHSRLYQNISVLEGQGLVERVDLNDRTTGLKLTSAGRELVRRESQEWIDAVNKLDEERELIADGGHDLEALYQGIRATVEADDDQERYIGDYGFEKTEDWHGSPVSHVVIEYDGEPYWTFRVWSPVRLEEGAQGTRVEAPRQPGQRAGRDGPGRGRRRDPRGRRLLETVAGEVTWRWG